MASVNYGLLIWIENAFYQIVGFVFLEVCVTQLRFCHLSYLPFSTQSSQFFWFSIFLNLTNFSTE